MIALSRRVTRRFRAAARKCSDGRGPAPPVVLRTSAGRVRLTVAYPNVTLEHDGPAPADTGTADATLIVPLGVFDAVGGTGDDPVTFACGPTLTGTANWAERGAARPVPVEFLLPGKQHEPRDRPEEMTDVPVRFLTALHEAGRTSSREDGRFALSRVQVRGQKGQVIATDGKVAVMFSGFTFPFAEDVLVPAVPLFGSPEVRDATEVRVGRTASHLVVSAGDWTVWLGVAPAGKFPDVAAVVPRHAPTTVAIDRDDAAGLLPRLPGLPAQGHDLRPVTLDADGALTVRAGDDTGAVQGVLLARSLVTGPAARVVLDRRALTRILALGCHKLRLTPGKALVGEGDGVTVLAALLDPELAVPSEPRAPGSDAKVPLTNPKHNPDPERNTGMKPQEPTGRPPGARPEPPTNDAPDPLAAAEELRAALADAATKAARLVDALKTSQKEKKVLATVYAGLQQLNLGTGGVR